MRTTSVKNLSGNHVFYVYSGDYVVLSTEDTPSGYNYHHLMKIRGVKSNGNRAESTMHL
ncbi:hypothetical protein [Paraclostridium sordellii]|uniref:hypothetical protein n=1 Tax=Paraclostridium sordellii TaxID=1505 RepID=UPI000AD1BF18|nr:hypothetical protein [Paeniclostridium sordellii]